MSRWTPLVLPLALGLTGCPADDGPAAGADEPAGEVAAVTGRVTARRSAEEAPERTLEKAGKLWADDTVTTAKDASLTVRLFHNEAAWTLGGGQTRRVDRSAAWRAPETAPSDLLAGRETEAVATSAGRHTEAEAAESAESALRPAPAAKSSPEPQASAPKPSRRKRRMRRPKREMPRAKQPSSKPAPGLAPGRPSVGSTPKQPSSEPASGQAPRRPSMRPAPRPTPQPPMADDAVPAERRVRATAKLKVLAVTGPWPAAVVEKDLRRRVGKLRGCYERRLKHEPELAGALVVVLKIGSSGEVTQVSVERDGVKDNGVALCVVEALRRVEVDQVDDGAASGTVRLELTFAP